MGKTLFMFSGQGSQYTGMGKELLEAAPSAEKIYETGSEILGYDLKKICFEADAATLAQTKYSQPCIFTTSLVALEAMKANGVSYDGVAGHSLGEYAAMVAAGVVSMEQGYRLIAKRAACMQECAEHQEGGMAAILTADTALVEKACAETEGYVVPANYNSSSQTVVAGEKAAVAAVCAYFAEQKVRCAPLAVAAAFHTKLMKPASDSFYAQIKEESFSAAKTDFFSNVLGGKLTDFSDMPSYLAKQIISPVKFTSELNAAAADGYNTFIELGPNKVLAGLVRKTLGGVSFANVENAATLEKVLQMLQK